MRVIITGLNPTNKDLSLSQLPLITTLLQTMFGDLVLADSQYGGNKGRRWKVDWDRAPQPIQIKLKSLRGKGSPMGYNG